MHSIPKLLIQIGFEFAPHQMIMLRVCAYIIFSQAIIISLHEKNSFGEGKLGIFAHDFHSSYFRSRKTGSISAAQL